MAQIRTVRTVCRECNENCGILVYVKDDKAIKAESAPGLTPSRYDTCDRGKTGLERLNHPKRLKYPLKRTGERGAGKWERISWNEAIDEITQKFQDARQRCGAESVALVKGFYDRHADFVSRLGNTFGTPNVTSIDNTCYVPSAVGRLLTYGYDGATDLSGKPDCILCWGSRSNPPLKEGGKLIVVNILETDAAKKADIWLRPRPATDLALALGILNVIVSEKLYDADFVKEWTTGFDKLEKHIQQYSPDKVSEITWVPEDKIIEAARLFTSFKYASLMCGNAGDDIINSSQFSRALSIIQAICGRLDIPGGMIEVEGIIRREGTAGDVLRHILLDEQAAKKLGADLGYLPYSELWNSIGSKPLEVHPQHLVSAILEDKPYPIEAVAVFGSNPLLTWSNSARVLDSLKKVPFLVVSDLVMTPTAAMADIILPVASYLETDGIAISALRTGTTYIQAQNKVVQVGECLSNQEIVLRLADKLGLVNYFWKNLHSYLDEYLYPTGMTFDELRSSAGVISSTTRYRKYLTEGFNTPSGKVEIYSSLCEQWGYDPLPVYREPDETPVSSPDMVSEYPLILTSAHEDEYRHSQDRYIESLRKRKPGPQVIMHPATASELNIAEGDTVFIENKRGRIRQEATLNDTIAPQVISTTHGWWFPEREDLPLYGWDEANINMLTDDAPPYSPEMGSPKMKGFLCKVYKT